MVGGNAQMNANKQYQLEALLSYCRTLGLMTRYCPGDTYFTAIAWNTSARPLDEEDAGAIQKRVQEKTAQYPGLVCYRFDPFSTLVYTV